MTVSIDYFQGMVTRRAIPRRASFKALHNAPLTTVFAMLWMAFGSQADQSAPRPALDDAHLHILRVNNEGMLVSPTNRSDKRLEFEAATQYVDTLVDGIVRNAPRVPSPSSPDGAGKRQILIFVHGGLNSINTSLERAATLLSKDPAHASQSIPRDRFYPVLLHWNSGFGPSYLEHLLYVRQGEVSRKLGPWTVPFVFSYDVGRAAFHAPATWSLQVKSDLETTRFFTQRMRNTKGIFAELRKPTRETAPATSGRAAPRQALEVSMGKDLRSNWDGAQAFVRYFATLPIKLASGPIIDAGGRPSWENLVRRTQVMFRTHREFDLVGSGNKPADFLDAAPEGAVSLFMEKLSQALEPEAMRGEARTGGQDYEITLVGHSMGAIILNEMIRRYPHLNYRNIVYLAAACSVSEFEQDVLPCLRSHPEAHFYNLCLHPSAETRETNVADLIPRGSLLEWLDNFLTTPGTVPERRLGKWMNFIQCVRLIPPPLRGRVHGKAFGVAGKAREEIPPLWHEGEGVMDHVGVNPQKHHDFSLERFWESGFWSPGNAE